MEENQESKTLTQKVREREEQELLLKIFNKNEGK